jgi:hypothetical protein
MVAKQVLHNRLNRPRGVLHRYYPTKEAALDAAQRLWRTWWAEGLRSGWNGSTLGMAQRCRPAAIAVSYGL